MSFFRKRHPALLVLLLLPLVFSTRADAIFQFCARVVAEHTGRSPAGILFEKAAQATLPESESLPFVFTSVMRGWRRAVKEETTGVLLYVKNQKVVVEYEVEGRETTVKFIDEDLVEDLIEHSGDGATTQAHAILTRFMDEHVVPLVLMEFQSAVLYSLEKAATNADHTGGTSTPHSTTWWPIREKGNIIGFHYEGVINTQLKRLVTAVSASEWVWAIMEVRLNRGRAEMLAFAEHRTPSKVYSWTEPLGVFFGERQISDSPVVRWSTCLGSERMLAGELTPAQTQRLDVAPIEISRAHLMGRDPRTNFEPLDLVGMTVLLQGGKFLVGQSARVVSQDHSASQSRYGGVWNSEVRVQVHEPMRFITPISRAYMVPAVDYLLNAGIDPGTMLPLVYAVGDRIVDKETFEEFEVVKVSAQLRVKAVAIAGDPFWASRERFIPAKYHFRQPVEKP